VKTTFKGSEAEKTSTSVGLLGTHPYYRKSNIFHVESRGQYDMDSLLTCTTSQLVTMVMNEGGRKHAVFNTNKLSDQGLRSITPTHTLCK